MKFFRGSKYNPGGLRWRWGSYDYAISRPFPGDGKFEPAITWSKVDDKRRAARLARRKSPVKTTLPAEEYKLSPRVKYLKKLALDDEKEKRKKKKLQERPGPILQKVDDGLSKETTRLRNV